MSLKQDLDGAFAFVTFGDLLTQTGELKAETIFRTLFDAGEWYIPRVSKVLRAGSNLLFYQSSVGFRGCATVTEISSSRSSSALSGAVNSFATQLRLAKKDEFKHPVQVGPLVDELDFVINKQFWGTALRGTPRAISAKDYLVIMRHAHVNRKLERK